MAFITYNKKYLTSNDNLCYLKDKENFMSFKKLTEYLNKLDFDKVIIMVRHAARPLNVDWSEENYYGKYVSITDYGISCAELAGEQLTDISDEFAYYATDTTRTKETALYISRGREDRVLKTTDDVLLFDSIENPEYIKDNDKYSNYVNNDGYYNVWYNFMYNGWYNDAFNDLATTSMTFVTTALENTNKKYNILISHDQNIMPLTVYLTDKKIEYRSNKWLNFISGIAIIKKDSELTYIPVTGMSTGFN